MGWFFKKESQYSNSIPEMEDDDFMEEPKHRTFLDRLFHKDADEDATEEEEEINELIEINLNEANQKKKRPSSELVVPDIHIGKKIEQRAGVASIKDIDAESSEELFTKKEKEIEEEIVEEENLQHGLTEEEYNYEFPKIEILDKDNELKEIVHSKEFTETQSKTILGLKGASNAKIIDFKATSHILITGADETGKTNLLDNIVINTIYKAKPSETKLLIIDTNGNGLSLYNGIPHLLIPVVTDVRKAEGALNWTVHEIENRFNLFLKTGVKDFDEYNELANEKNEPKLPNMIVIIDEIFHIRDDREIENALIRIASKGSITGVCLVLTTSKPFNKYISAEVRSNIYTMISLYFPNRARQKLVLDMYGTEKLTNPGDVLFKTLGKTIPQKYHCPYISMETVKKVVKSINKDGDSIYDSSINEFIEYNANPELVRPKKDFDEYNDGPDELLEEAIEYVIQYQTASATFLQTKLKIGYSRARLILDQIEERGIISRYQGSKPRTVLITPERWEELKVAPTSGEISDYGEEYDADAEYEDEEDWED